jgi:uncharacterized protein YndB with AHSA1/START domain
MDAEHRGTYVEIDRPRRLVFDFSVPPYTDDSTSRVALDFVPNGPTACEIVLTHELGDSPMAQAYEQQTRRGWTKMLDKLEREVFPRRIAL